MSDAGSSQGLHPDAAVGQALTAPPHPALQSMGIAGLLPNLKSITTKGHVSKYANQTAAVDAYCLLHRGAHACAQELVEGETTEKHVSYCMSRIHLLLRAGVTPYVVFDGDRLPAKGEEERTRERSREEAKAKARALWQQGNRTAAFECYQRAVDITPAVAKGFIDALKRRGVQFVVAPYEADAQMAYLALNGLVDVVITEDSDLLTYGCPVVFFKMDKGGDGEEVRLADLPQARELSLTNMTHQLFQEMCVMAGCDFCTSLPGVGMKKAHQQIKRCRDFAKAVRALRFNGTQVPSDYLLRFQRALWTFRHQRVFCPRRRTLVTLHPLPEGGLEAEARMPDAAVLAEGEADFLGPLLEDSVVQAIAVGDVDPISKRPFNMQQQQEGDTGSQSSGQEAARKQRPSGLVQQTLLSSLLASGGGADAAASKPFKAPRLASQGPRQAADSSCSSQEDALSSGEASLWPAMRRVGGLRAPPSRPSAAARAAPVAAASLEPQSQQQQRSQQLKGYRVPGLKQQSRRQAAAGPATSHFFSQRQQQERASSTSPGGGLLAALQAAVRQPSVEELLDERRQAEEEQIELDLLEDIEEDAEGSLQQEQELLGPVGSAGQPPSQLLAELEQQQHSPGIEDLLAARVAQPRSTGTPADQQEQEHSLWPLQRVQLPVAAAAEARQALGSPLHPGLALQPAGQGMRATPGTGLRPTPGTRLRFTPGSALGPTPGFYDAASEEEEREGCETAGEDREGNSQLLGLPPGSPIAASPLASFAAMDEAQRQQVRQQVRRLQLPALPGNDGSSEGRQQEQGAVEASLQQQPLEQQGSEQQEGLLLESVPGGSAPLGTAGGGGAGSSAAAEDAISSLAHLPAYAAEAEQAVNKALVAACEGALACRLPVLPQQARPQPQQGQQQRHQGQQQAQQQRQRGQRQQQQDGHFDQGASSAKRARLAAALSPLDSGQPARRGGKENSTQQQQNPFAVFALAKK